MNAEQYTAAVQLARALNLMPCSCEHNVPYAGCKIEQKVTKRCYRCRALEQWEMVGGEMPKQQQPET